MDHYTSTRVATMPGDNNTVPDDLAQVLLAWAKRRDRIAEVNPLEELAEVRIGDQHGSGNTMLLYLTSDDVDELCHRVLSP